MPLPPPWYMLLLGVTLVALPWLWRRAPGAEARRFVAWVVGGLLLFEVGLVLLFYERWLCWPLVAMGVACVASRSAVRQKRAAGALVLVPALLAGVAFEWLPDERGFYFYFGFAIPFLLLAAFVPVLARWVASGAPRYLVACGAVLAFAAFTPAAAFGFTFLEHYEVFQLPALLAALWGIGVMTGPRGWADAHAPGAIAAGATIAERLASPWASQLSWGPVFLVLGVMVGWLALRHAPLPGLFPYAAWLGVGLALAGAGLAATARGARSAGPALIFGGLAAAVASLLGVRFGAEAFHVFIGGGPALETTYFYIAGVGLLLVALAAALAWARVREQTRRARLAREPHRLVQRDRLAVSSLPDGFLVERVPRVPAVGALVAFRERLVAASAAGGVLDVEAGAADPLGGLPEPVSLWLSTQARSPLVHLAVREGREVFLVPLLDPEEGP